MNKTVYIIGGPNGAGKTTFARHFLPEEAKCINYINADLIAAGLSPFAPQNVKIKAGKLMLQEIDRCVSCDESFAFETTLSGNLYVQKILRWRALGYRVVLIYFSLPSAEMAIDRVNFRVEQGGHHIPENDVRRRFDRSKENLEVVYKGIVDSWVVIDTSSTVPIVIEES